LRLIIVYSPKTLALPAFQETCPQTLAQQGFQPITEKYAVLHAS
jgi:hypothetical protein